MRLLVADQGAYHHEDVSIPAEVLGRYERLIDCLREDPTVLRVTDVDVTRLCAAWLVNGQGGG